MHKTNLKEIAATLQEIDLGREPVVLLHSNLFSFGIIENGLAGLYGLLLEWLGQDATLLMPAFSYHNDPAKPWECKRTGAKTGALTEYFRKMPGVIRSIHPIHSVTAIGKHAEYFTNEVEESAFGSKSAFAKLYLRNAHNISLGTGFEGGATYLHYAEESLQVPYRSYVTIPVKVIDANDMVVDKQFVHYARIETEEFGYENEWGQAWTDLSEAGVFTTRRIGPAKIIHSKMRDGINLLYDKIKANAFYCARRVDKTSIQL